MMNHQEANANPLSGVTVKDRSPCVHGAGTAWSVFDDSDDFVELRPDGLWHDVNNARQYFWPTKAAAIAFCLQHADQPPKPEHLAGDSEFAAEMAGWNALSDEALRKCDAEIEVAEYDLPTAPGRWQREDGKWDLLVDSWHSLGTLQACGWHGEAEYRTELIPRFYELPKGGWRPVAEDSEGLRRELEELREFRRKALAPAVAEVCLKPSRAELVADNARLSAELDKAKKTDEYQEQKERISKIKRATCEGCLAAALSKPLHAVAESGYDARSYQGDAWEQGWEYFNGSAKWQSELSALKQQGAVIRGDARSVSWWEGHVPLPSPAPAAEGKAGCSCRMDGNHGVDATGCPIHSRKAMSERAAEPAQGAAKRLEELRGLLAAWKAADEERLKETDEAHQEAEKWKSEGDMYGYNFHEGRSGGTIWASIIYDRVRRELERLIAEREGRG